jgi:hypothetical protein
LGKETNYPFACAFVREWQDAEVGMELVGKEDIDSPSYGWRLRRQWSILTCREANSLAVGSRLQ